MKYVQSEELVTSISPLLAGSDLILCLLGALRCQDGARGRMFLHTAAETLPLLPCSGVGSDSPSCFSVNLLSVGLSGVKLSAWDLIG